LAKAEGLRVRGQFELHSKKEREKKRERKNTEELRAVAFFWLL
jgi:hypothetical protein